MLPLDPIVADAPVPRDFDILASTQAESWWRRSAARTPSRSDGSMIPLPRELKGGTLSKPSLLRASSCVLRPRTGNETRIRQEKRPPTETNVGVWGTRPERVAFGVSSSPGNRGTRREERSFSAEEEPEEGGNFPSPTS